MGEENRRILFQFNYDSREYRIVSIDEIEGLAKEDFSFTSEAKLQCFEKNDDLIISNRVGLPMPEVVYIETDFKTITATVKNSISTGLINQIKDIISARKRFIYKLIKVLFYASILFSIIVISTDFFAIKVLSFWLTWVFVFAVTESFNTLIILKLKKDSPTFIEKNRDSIIIGTILLIMGIILGDSEFININEILVGFTN